MQARQRRMRYALLALVAAIAIGVPLALGAVGALDRLDLATYDARLSIRGDQTPSPDVALVGLDAKTTEALGQPPYPRKKHARAIELLHEAGAKVIAYDLRFQGKTTKADDQALIKSISQNRPVVLATANAGGKPIPVPAGHKHPENIGASLASIAVPTDSDDNVREFLFVPVGNLRTLPVVAGGLFLGEKVKGSNFEDNMAWIDYPGPPGTVPSYSFIDLLKGKVPHDAFDGKVVVVGPTDPIQKDVFQTPTSDSPMAGPEIQADATATVIDGFPIQDAPRAVDIVLLVALGLVAPLIALRRNALLILLAALGALALFLVGAQLAYNAGKVIDVSEPVLGLLIGTAGALIVHYTLFVRERSHLRNLFSRFVPPEVVNEVVDRVDEDLRLGAVRRDGTVMFCDLRGFTSFSENLEPELVVEVVNRYLSEMTDAILAHGGTLVAFMGDGIMALFGAPIEQPDHADRAVSAAREMLSDKLPSFNAWMGDRGIDQRFRMGIGLNSGQVMSGNVGSQQRLEYTALGDTTNTAARLEGMTKGTEHQLYLAESTYERMKEPPPDATFVGELEVRGREHKLRVWTLA